MRKQVCHVKERICFGVFLGIVLTGLTGSILGLFLAMFAGLGYDEMRNSIVNKFKVDGRLVFVGFMLIPVFMVLLRL